MNDAVTWRKSSYSQNDSACVEISSDRQMIRDSKNPDGPVLRGDVNLFIEHIKETYTHPAQ